MHGSDVSWREQVPRSGVCGRGRLDSDQVSRPLHGTGPSPLPTPHSFQNGGDDRERIPRGGINRQGLSLSRRLSPDVGPMRGGVTGR